MIFPFPYSKGGSIINATDVFIGISSTPYNESTGFDITSNLETTRAFQRPYTNIVHTSNTLLLNWDSLFNNNNFVGYAYVFIPNNLFGYLVTHRKESVSGIQDWNVLAPNQVGSIDFAYSANHTYNGIDGKFLYAKGVYRVDGSYNGTMYANYLFTNNP